MDYQQKIVRRTVEEGVGSDFIRADGYSGDKFILSLQRRQWMYRGEGNANIVIALSQEGRVIRLRKGHKHGLFPSEDSAAFSLEAKFYKKIMIPFLGSCFVSPPTIVSVDSREILELESQLYQQRPVARLHKEIKSTEAALYMDYTKLPANSDSEKSQMFPTYCIEIKPKQGWVPKPDRQLHKCKYCLHQYLKVITKKIRKRSQYCPLDLFSGNSWRMRKALCALLDNPQNNLKIFKDGILVYGEQENNSSLPILKEWLSCPSRIQEAETLQDKFCYVLIEALTRDMILSRKPFEIIQDNAEKNFSSQFEDADGCITDLSPSLLHKYIEFDFSSHDVDTERYATVEVERIPADMIKTVKSIALDALDSGKENSCQWDSLEQANFPENCVLKRILGIQKLDKYGADHTYQQYLNELKLGKAVSNFSYTNTLMTSDRMWSSVQLYLLATTARDCSIMVTFREELNSRVIDLQKQNVVQCSDGQKFSFNIGIIDLEPKPLSCIEKHRLRDLEILKGYIDWYMSKEKNCLSVV